MLGWCLCKVMDQSIQSRLKVSGHSDMGFAIR